MIKRLVRDRKGNMIMIASLAMPLFVGGAGLAMDTVQWTLWKRQIQQQADSAAMAGALSSLQNGDVQSVATADITRNMKVDLTGTPIIEQGPSDGPFAGDVHAVRVTLNAQKTLPFTRFLGIQAPALSAVATAAVVNDGNYCVISLEDQPAAGITMQGNSSVNLGCGISTNASASNAVIAGGSSTVIATPVAAVGGIDASDNYTGDTTLQPYSLPQLDPYSDLPDPSVSGCSAPVTVNTHGTRNLVPGCYRGITVRGTLNLAPGVYYIDGGSFNVGSQGVVNGTGVTIILTSEDAYSDPEDIATLNINGGAELNPSATTSGTYAGVLFYQDRRAIDGGSNQVNGNASSFLQGSFYFPGQELVFNGTAGMSTDCVQLVSRRVTFSGNSAISDTCPTDSGAGSFTGTRVRLVG